MPDLAVVHGYVQALMKLETARNPSAEFDIDALADRAIEIVARVESRVKAKVPPPKMRHLPEVMQ